MMRVRQFSIIFLLLFLISGFAGATEQAGHESKTSSSDAAHKIRNAVTHILLNNATFMKTHGEQYFKPFVESQHPLATIVSCSDSRVHMHAFDASPDDDLFVIRNIGNQLATAEGSVDYGVHHLHTPVLMFIGHVRCGAIKAASGDYSGESAAIKKELDAIRIKRDAEWLDNVVTNINNQVSAAAGKYAEEIREGRLVVIGAVYDFANDLKQGSGRLEIINVNGDTSYFKVKSFLGNNAPGQVSAASHQKEPQPAKNGKIRKKR